MSLADIPVLVDMSFFFFEPLGDEKALCHYVDGTVRFYHRCDRGELGVIVCAPLLQLDDGHTITVAWVAPDIPRAGSTITPSILCADCGTHGFVTAGVWRSC